MNAAQDSCEKLVQAGAMDLVQKPFGGTLRSSGFAAAHAASCSTKNDKNDEKAPQKLLGVALCTVHVVLAYIGRSQYLKLRYSDSFASEQCENGHESGAFDASHRAQQ